MTVQPSTGDKAADDTNDDPTLEDAFIALVERWDEEHGQQQEAA